MAEALKIRVGYLLTELFAHTLVFLCALSLKLSEIELVKSITGDTPVLLLDDVFSELDANRQNYLLDSISDVQTIVTCTGLDEFINNRFHLDKVFYVTNGHVIEKN